MRHRTEVAWAFVVGCASMPLAFGILGRSLADWTIPLNYEGDALNVLAIAKMGMERTWASGSDRLGAPGALDMAYYPMPETGQLLLLKLLGMVLPSAAIVVNAYLFLTFALCAASATWVLCRLDLRMPAAALGGLAFSLLPYHFGRAEGHLFVNGYYWVPLLCLVLLRLHVAASPRRIALCAMVAFMAPFVNVYYSFFFAVLLLATKTCDALAQRRREPLMHLAALLAALSVGFTLNLARSLPLYVTHKLGFSRQPDQAERFGLKLAQMVIPTFETVSTYIQRVNDRYVASAPLNSENAWNDLGLLVGCAFLVSLLMGFVLAQRRAHDDSSQRDIFMACWCILVCVLYGTIGGFSSVFSYLVSPFIRSPNRIGIYIAFLSIVAALLQLQPWMARAPRLRKRTANACIYGVLICLMYWDLSHKLLTPNLAQTNARYERDVAYFAALERSLPEGARILQVPHVIYPEGGPHDAEWNGFRGYLHTRALVWSYGAARNDAAPQDPSGVATANLSRGDILAFMQYAHAHDFTGVLLDRTVERLRFMRLEPLLDSTLRKDPQSRPDDPFVYYALKR